MEQPQNPIQESVQVPTPISTPVPVSPAKHNWITITLSVFSITLLLLIAFLSFQNQQLKKQSASPQVSPTIKVPSSSPTPRVSSISISPDEIDNWETLTGNKFMYENSTYSGYSVKYPPICTKGMNNTLTCKTTHGNATLVVNAGGHGLPFNIKTLKNNEIKTVPAGSGFFSEFQFDDSQTILGVFSINKTNLLTQEPIFMFEFNNLPISDVKEFEELFDQILSTFKFVK